VTFADAIVRPNIDEQKKMKDHPQTNSSQGSEDDRAFREACLRHQDGKFV
jgi:hypothetical protein